MERVSVLCLSLLFCSLSGAELQDNEIIEQREVSPESVNVPEPQPCPSDLHAVLREMSVKLAKYEVKLEHLQTLNQEQNAKLAKNEFKIEQLQTLNQEQAAKLKQLEKQSSHMDSQQQVGQVAFSASLLASGSGHTGPFNTHTTLVFRGVVSNIGNAYNPHTGIFTAPVRGAYHFEFYIFAQGGSSGSTRVGLEKNGEHVFNAQEIQSTGWGSASNGVTLLLEAGDVVFLRLWANFIIYDDSNHYSTFSGHLLFPM
uniref:C1q domain-containing protein n=1 Tax=Neogobius melanostomus TaxID=47308 RepID=A0A8C6UEA5_9GOBI